MIYLLHTWSKHKISHSEIFALTPKIRFLLYNRSISNWRDLWYRENNFRTYNESIQVSCKNALHTTCSPTRSIWPLLIINMSCMHGGGGGGTRSKVKFGVCFTPRVRPNVSWLTHCMHNLNTYTWDCTPWHLCPKPEDVLCLSYILKTPGSAWPGKESIGVILNSWSNVTKNLVSFLQTWQIMESVWPSPGSYSAWSGLISGSSLTAMEFGPNGPFMGQVWPWCFYRV